VDVARVREELLEERQALHVHRGLVAPPALAVGGGVALVHRPDRGAEGHPGAEAGPDLFDGEVPLADRGKPAQVVDERVDVHVRARALAE
jgi:hypothetical protein